jgi:hypothetical protein
MWGVLVQRMRWRLSTVMGVGGAKLNDAAVELLKCG